MSDEQQSETTANTQPTSSRHPLLGWPGYFADASKRARIAVFMVLQAASVALVFSQLGFLAVGGIHIFTVLAVVALGSFVFGTRGGTMLGFILGVALMIHAIVLPLDYYEMYFASPINSILLFSLMGMLFGVLFAWATRFDDRSRAWRLGMLFVASLLGSFVCTAFFQVASYLLNALFLKHELPTEFFQVLFSGRSFGPQILLDAVLVWVLVFLGGMLVRWQYANREQRTLRMMFEGWLAIVCALAFALVAATSFTVLTVSKKAAANQTLTSQLDYLKNQLADHDERYETLVTTERQSLLDKARSVAQFLGDYPQESTNNDYLAELANSLGLTTLTTCDETGTVVGDSAGVGVGTFNFASTSETSKYLELLDGTSTQVVEDPRMPVDGRSDSELVYVGVPLEQGGFVQASISAADYEEALSAVSAESLAEGFTFSKGGLVVVAENDEIVTANESSLIGQSFDETVLASTGTTTAEELFNTTELTSYYAGNGSEISFARGVEISFVRAAKVGNYQILVTMPSSEVFADRTNMLLFNTAFFLALFLAVFLLASYLLNDVVVRGFVRTNETLGAIAEGNLDEEVDVHGVVEFDRLSNGINTMVGSLKESIEEAQTRLDNELATARAIQESALPSTFPPFPDISSFDIFAMMTPAKEIGGDFYDFFLVDDHTLGFLIADVSGKGIPGALFMMTAKTQIENFMQSGMSLSEAVTNANHHLCIGNDAQMFVTAWMATLDYKTGHLTYVNAGHNPPLLRHDGTWKWLREKSGLFLASFDGLDYRSFELDLAPGDEIFLYTDGVTEAMDSSEQMFGEDRLLELLQERSLERNPKSTVRSVQFHLGDYVGDAEQHDDITMLALAYGVAPEASEEIVLPAQVEQLDTVMYVIHEELSRRFCPITAQRQLDIAIEELFVNVCRHAYPDATEDNPGHVVVSYVYRADPASITIQIADTGIPFDPIEAADPSKPSSTQEAKIGGLGIFMAKKNVDDISYLRDGDWNIIAFTKSW